MADFYKFYTFALTTAIGSAVMELDVLADHPRIQAVIERMAGQPSIVRVEADNAG